MIFHVDINLKQKHLAGKRKYLKASLCNTPHSSEKGQITIELASN